MSYLRNPLDDFQSYSTHFIMLAARTTEKARNFASEKNNAAALAAIDSVKSLGEPVSFGGSKDTAYLVIDTRRFSQFTIESMKYKVLVNGLMNDTSPANFAGTVDMTIVDSVGVSFVNFMRWLTDEKMQTNFDGVIFLLKILFVGHKDDGTTETVQTVTIPMMLAGMELSLDAVRGTYPCTFFPLVNFSARDNSRWLNIGTASTYFTGKGENTLGAMVKSFESELNRRSEEYYTKASAALLQYHNPRPGSDKFGRRVKYQITLPTGWDKFQFNGSSTGAATETNFVDLIKKTETAKQTAAQKNASAQDAGKSPTTDSHLSVPAGLGITEVLDIMFKQVHEVHLRGIPSDQKPVTFHKFLVGLTSDDDAVTVHVDVLEFTVPRAVLANTPSSPSNKTIEENEAKWYEVRDGVRVPKNSFDLDYIFTGKNKDVLSFDMKLQHLDFYLRANMKVGEGELYNVSNVGQGDKKDGAAGDSDLINMRAYDPIMIPMNSDAELKNFTQFAARQSTEVQKNIANDYQRYTRNLSLFYANSPNQVNITLRGNPLLMQKFNVGELLKMPDVGSTSTPNSDGTYRSDLEERVLSDNSAFRKSTDGSFSLLTGPNYTTSPVFIKLNVMGPNVDFRTNELIDGKDFATKILFDQYYDVREVHNSIDHGVFTQELMLYTHNMYVTPSQTTEKQVSKI